MLKRISSRLQEVGAVRKRPLIIFHARVPIIKVRCWAALGCSLINYTYFFICIETMPAISCFCLLFCCFQLIGHA